MERGLQMRIPEYYLIQPLLDLFHADTQKEPGNASQTRRPITVVAVCVNAMHR